MEKIKFKFNEVYFGNNCRKSIKITNHNSWAITSKIFPSSDSHSESQESFSFLDDRCWVRPSSIWSILLSSCSTDGSLTSGSISVHGSNGSKQVSPFFSAFVPPATWNNLFPFGYGHVILEINKRFRMNWFQGSKSEFNLDLFDFFTFIKLLSYLIVIPFIKISRFSKLEFRGLPKKFRNLRNKISRSAKNLDIRGN